MYRQIAKQREFLRHIADFWFQQVCVAGDLGTQYVGRTEGRRQQTAEHADGR